jgi:hypothetical protein
MSDPKKLDWGDDFFQDIYYQEDFGSFFCISCRAAFHGVEHHMRTKHKQGDITKERKKSIATQGKALNVPDKPRSPSRIIAPLSWLPDPVKGYGCSLCLTSGPNAEAIKSHLMKAHIPIAKEDYGKHILPNCYFQRLGRTVPGFRVDPVLSNSPASGATFPAFYSKLSTMWQNGGIMKAAALASKTTREYDISGFMARAGWVDAIAGYSVKGLRRKVALTCAKDHHMLRLKGLTAEFFGQFKNLNDVHPLVLQELTSWQKT